MKHFLLLVLASFGLLATVPPASAQVGLATTSTPSGQLESTVVKTDAQGTPIATNRLNFTTGELIVTGYAFAAGHDEPTQELFQRAEQRARSYLVAATREQAQHMTDLLEETNNKVSAQFSSWGYTDATLPTWTLDGEPRFGIDRRGQQYCAVTIRSFYGGTFLAKLRAALELQGNPKPFVPSQAELRSVAHSRPAQTGERVPVPTPSAKPPQQEVSARPYTHLIVHAEKTAAKPTSVHRILVDGADPVTMVYGPPTLGAAFFEKHNMVGYATDEAHARQMCGKNSNPLVVDATNSDGINVSVDRKTAVKVYEANLDGGQFLSKGNVVLILAPMREAKVATP